MGQDLSKARFLTVQEVADLMRVSTMTVYRIIKSGELPAVRAPQEGVLCLRRLAAIAAALG